MTDALVNESPRPAQRDFAVIGFAAVLVALLAHTWFASTPLPFGGPNIPLALLAIALAALSLSQAAWSARDVAAIRQRLRNILPAVLVAALMPLWALAVYLATDTLDARRLAKMGLGIGILFAVFVCVDNLRRARAMVFLFVLAIAASALWGFAMVFVGDPFRGLWLRIANVPQEELQEMLLFGRMSGLAAHIAVFGRQLVVAIPLALAALLFWNCAGRRWLGRAALAALFVLLMTLVTAMLMNATRSVVLSAGVVAAIVAAFAVRSPRPRGRLLVFAPLAGLWLLVYFNAGDAAVATDAEASSGVGGVHADIQDLAAGDDALRAGESDRIGHLFVGNEPGVEYEVQVRERHPAGYGQPGMVAVRADEQGAFVLTWRKRPGITLYQSCLRVRGQDDWSVWTPFEPSLEPETRQAEAPVALQDVVVGSVWLAHVGDHERIGHRVGGLEPGAEYIVELKPETIGDRGDRNIVPVTTGEDGAFVMTWRVPSEAGIMGYVYRLRKPDEWWGRYHEFEPSMKIVAEADTALPDLAVGGRSLVSGGKSARVGHAFGGFVPWFWYAVQVRQTDARGVAKIGEATVKPDEGGNFVLTWGAPPQASEIVGHQFRAHDISRKEWSPWKDFVPSLSSRVPTLEPFAVHGEAPAASENDGIGRHTLAGLSPNFTYRAQLRARSGQAYGPETRDVTLSSTQDGTWTFAWREPGSDLAITGYQFRLWWRAKDRWWPWQDFAPTADGSGQTKAVFDGHLNTAQQNVAAARTTELLGVEAKKATIGRVADDAALTRLHGLTTVLRYVRDHPLGTGVYAPQSSHVTAGLSDRLVEELLRLWPHNQGLHVLVLFGWPGLALLVAFYVCVLRPVVRCVAFAWRAADSELRFLAVGVVGAWAAYSINSLLVPTGPFLGGWSHFYLIGLLFGVERLVERARAAARA